MLMPRAIAMLKRALTSAARLGLSTTTLLSMDKAVVDAIHERQSQYKEDGNLAIEYVCNQRTDLFRPPTLALSDVTADNPTNFRSRDATSSIGPSASMVDAASYTSAAPSHGKASMLERKMQSERDSARAELKRLRSVLDSSNANPRRNNPVRYGGDSRRSGGGDPRSNHVCRDFNGPNGCERENCKFKHVCSKVDRNGRVCGDSRHSAVLHS